MNRIVTIHQPDFMPWAGFFRKIQKSDLWIVLDHVSNNPRDSKFWGRRVKLLVNNREYWLSVPLEKPKGITSVPINTMRIKSDFFNGVNNHKVRKTLDQQYIRYPFFKEFKYLYEDYFDDISQSLMDKNMRFIQEVMSILNINTEIIYSSELNTKGQSNELLVELLEAVDAKKYISGDGADGYMDVEIYRESNIQVYKNNFDSNLKYNQFSNSGVFIGGLSIIDCLMSVGKKGTIRYLNSQK